MTENIVLRSSFSISCSSAYFAMKYCATIMQAKAKYAQEQSFRELAAQVAQTQDEQTGMLLANNTCLADIQARLIRLEKILQDVE